LIFDNVIGKNKLAPFLWLTVYVLNLFESISLKGDAINVLTWVLFTFKIGYKM